MDRRHMADDENKAYSRYSHSEEIKRADFPPVGQCGKINESFDISKILGGILGSGNDSEKLLIAALIFLLIREGADKKLIIALGYIML